MHLIKKSYTVLAVTLFAVPSFAYADSWSCSRSNNVREVHIERTSSAPVPCNVVYRKLTEGFEGQVLWNANNDETYCDEKAKGLIDTLESAGWVCTETISDTHGVDDSESTVDESP
ncbi:MAG: hypothetical protein ACC650_02665 [Gammaproteobacteria bacterium]